MKLDVEVNERGFSLTMGSGRDTRQTKVPDPGTCLGVSVLSRGQDDLGSSSYAN